MQRTRLILSLFSITLVIAGFPLLVSSNAVTDSGDTAHAQSQHCPADIYARVFFDKVNNRGRGNAEASVYVNGQRREPGTQIPLVLNGQDIVDPAPNTNVPGLTFQRLGNGQFRIVSHYEQRPQDFEIFYGRILLDGATYAGITNDRVHPYEDARDGSHGIRNPNPNFSLGEGYRHNDEFRAPLGSMQLEFYAGGAPDLDILTASYVRTGNCGNQPQCRDGMDNDGDGLVDFGQDPGCFGPDDQSEVNTGSSSSSIPRPQCSDGSDNDFDGRVDFNDPGCYVNGQYNPNDNNESDQGSSSSSSMGPQCSDGRDNDNDGRVDYNDPGCYVNGQYNPNDNDENDQQNRPQCSDNQDNDHDGQIDYNDPGCYTNGSYNPNDNDERNFMSSSSSSHGPACSDGRDNDNDNKVDHNDPGCYTNGQYNPHDNNEQDGGQCYGHGCSSSSSSYRAQCSDGRDNDGDYRADAQDPGCYVNGQYNPHDNNEQDSGQCYGYGCSSSSSSSYRAQCSDGRDNDGDNRADAQDPGCYTSDNRYDPNDNNESDHGSCHGYGCSSSSSSNYGGQCADGRDNDWDGRIDRQDPSCYMHGYYNPHGSEHGGGQQGWDPYGRSWEQNADVNASANTDVNSTINAGSQNNTSVEQNGGGW
jgi:hypothetical protein